MRISCICCTYKRPVELANMIACFEAQDYDDRELIIIDDAGQYEPLTVSGKWQLHSYTVRMNTLGGKRNQSAIKATGDILSVWDDDDIYLPWHLSTIAKTFEGQAESVAIPSQVWIHRRNQPLRLKTGIKGMFHGAWSFSHELFDRVGGYTEMQSGQDQDLLRKFRKHGCDQLDPIEHDARPSYIYRFGTIQGGYNLSSRGWNDQEFFQSLGERPVEFQTQIVPKLERDWNLAFQQAMQVV